jgi:hypothetical protein
MEHNARRVSPSALVLVLLLILILLSVPLVLSNNFSGSVSAILLLAIVFIFPGYLFLNLLGEPPSGLRMLLSPVFGIVTITTAYDIFSLSAKDAYFPYYMVFLAAAGIVIFALQIRRGAPLSEWTKQDCESLLAGGVVALCVAPVLWRSGRFSDGEFVFYGPAGQDQLFHVTLLQRLLHHVPPDNFMVSGLRPTIYHYFDDLALALILRCQNALHLHAIDVFDLYYRCYPVLVYFLIGALAYRIGRQCLGKASGGVLSVLLLLGAGGLGWFFGVLQTALHAAHFAAMRASLFSDWASWEGIDSILPLVHRPAHYHGLLISLAAINLLLRKETSRRDWILAGLLLGLMAGFNFTLAATLGFSAAVATLILFLQRPRSEAGNLAWLSLFILLGSLPIAAAMVFSGFHNMAPGFPFRGPNLEYPIAAWGTTLARVVPAALVPWASLIVFPIVAFGVKLFGIGPMLRLDLGEQFLRGIAIVLAITFALNFTIGAFFPYQGTGIAVAFLQPPLWILGLFSLRPLHAWLERNRANWRPLALWGMLALTWVQALGAFNFSSKATFSQETVRALQDVRSAAAPDDVVAYLPSDLIETAIWGHAMESTNFAIMAMTGLDGYFSSPDYSRFSAVPGLQGRNQADVFAQADHLYQQRHDDVGAFLKGDIDGDASARLASDRVHWIVVSGNSVPDISSSAVPWRKTDELVVYRISP